MSNLLNLKRTRAKVNQARLNALALVSTTTGFLMSSMAYAADSASVTAINDAVADGKSLVGLVAPGVIGIAALMLGVGLVVAWLRK